MAIVGSLITARVPTTLNTTAQFTPWVGRAVLSIMLRFSSGWSGTLTFEGGTVVSGSFVSDPVLATNRNDNTSATTTAGGASTDEIWQIDASSMDGVRVNATLVTAGSVTVTYTWD